MKLINQEIELLSKETYQDMLNVLEEVARNCYQSEINTETNENFVKKIIEMGHNSVLEHVSFRFKITTDRSTANQIVRHRTGKYAQESQRYCNYLKGKFGSEITFIIQPNQNDEMTNHFQQCEGVYFSLIQQGFSPEEARCILPNATKTTLIMTMDLRNLRNFLKLRLSNHAQYNIREIAEMMYELLNKYYPIFTLEIKEEIDENQ